MCSPSNHDFQALDDLYTKDCEDKHFLHFCTKCGAILETNYFHKSGIVSCEIIEPNKS